MNEDKVTAAVNKQLATLPCCTVCGKPALPMGQRKDGAGVLCHACGFAEASKSRGKKECSCSHCRAMRFGVQKLSGVRQPASLPDQLALF